MSKKIYGRLDKFENQLDIIIKSNKLICERLDKIENQLDIMEQEKTELEKRIDRIEDQLSTYGYLFYDFFKLNDSRLEMQEKYLPILLETVFTDTTNITHDILKQIGVYQKDMSDIIRQNNKIIGSNLSNITERYLKLKNTTIKLSNTLKKMPIRSTIDIPDNREQ